MAIITIKKAVFLLLFILLISNNSFAKTDINKFNPSISVGLTYTDNVDLSHSNEESDLVLRVTPSLGTGITTEGSRLRTQLNYSVSGLSYESNSDSNDIYHNLSSSATAEIVKNSIFLDGFANTRQVLLDQNTSASSDNISGSDNLTNTYTYGLTASWKKKWRNYATSDISYGYNEAKFGGGSSGSDSSGNQINALLASGPKFSQYFWDLNYNYNKTSYDSDSPDTTSKLYYVTLGYHYSRLLDLRVRLGYEDYDDAFEIDSNGNRTNNDNGGFGWTIGGNWHPSPRTSLDASWGERAFGRTAFLDFSHRMKRLTWQVNYSDDITNSRGQLIENSQAINDINANPDNNQDTNINNIDVPLATFNPNLRLTRRLTGSASYRFSKSTFSLRVYAERIFYDDTDNENNDNQGASLDWRFRLGGKTSMSTRLSWDRLKDLDVDNTQNRKGLSWSLNRTFSPTLSGRIEYRYTNNDADLLESEYDENRITATISKSYR